MSIYHDILRRPLITEKSHNLKEKNKHMFVVISRANKKTVKNAVEDVFKVKVACVNMILVNKKKIKFKGISGMSSAYKKAIVTLQVGQKLELSKWKT